MKWFTKRLSEPSTWAGIAAVIFGGSTVSDLHPAMTPEFVSMTIATVAGLIAIFKKSPNEEAK